MPYEKRLVSAADTLHHVIHGTLTEEDGNVVQCEKYRAAREENEVEILRNELIPRHFFQPENRHQHRPREPHGEIEPDRLHRKGDGVQPPLFYVFFLQEIEERMPAEEHRVGQEPHDPHHKPRKQERENDGGGKREKVSPNKLFGERHHEREYGDDDARREQEIDVCAQRERYDRDRARDGGQRGLK